MSTIDSLANLRVQHERTAADSRSLAIETRGLVKRYGTNTALAGLTMAVPRGEVFGFLGPNGAGKTTAVKLLLGLTHPTSGEARVLGAPIGHRETRRRIGYLPELFRYQGWLSAWEVLTFHCELAGVPKARRKNEIESALAIVGLTNRAKDRVETYSKGMQQRLGLGVALLGEPEVVFLDEPTSALDPVGRHDVREIIRGLKNRGTAVFLNSHLLSEVELVCDRVAVVDHGQVIALGALDEIVGQTNAARLRIVDLPVAAEAALERFGTVTVANDWYIVAGVTPERIPDLVAAVAASGGRIYAVEPLHQTLEERFLEILHGSRSGGPS